MNIFTGIRHLLTDTSGLGFQVTWRDERASLALWCERTLLEGRHGGDVGDPPAPSSRRGTTTNGKGISRAVDEGANQ